MSKNKLIRITTVPLSLKLLLKDQLKYMNQYFDVIAISSSGKDLQEVEGSQGVRVESIEMSRQITPLKDLVSLYKMGVLLSKEKPEIVHTHTPKAGLIGMLGAWITRVPHRLHTVAGLPVMESSGIKRKILMFVEWLTYKCATHVYPNSIGLEEFILANNLTTSAKIKVLGNGSSNGIDTNYFSRAEEVMGNASKVKNEYKLFDDDFVYIFIGRIVKDKGINELLSSFEILSKIEQTIKLLLVGPFEDHLDPISEESRDILKSNKNIIEVGYQDDIRPFLAISDCLVFPSYREGFPNVVMQAGSMGLPAIVSDINGCNEIVEDGINGLIIPVKDSKALEESMWKIYQDDELRIGLAQNARKQIVDRYDQQFVWQAIKDEYMASGTNADQNSGKSIADEVYQSNRRR